MKKTVKLMLIAGMVLMLSCCFGVRAYAEEGKEAADAVAAETPPATEQWTDPEPKEEEKEPEPKPEPVEEVKEETAENVVVNAIQTQVNEAIKNMASSEDSAYVRIDEGNYEGDINIQAPTTEGSGSITSSQTLYLLAPGSYEEKDGKVNTESIGATADGNTTMNGNVNIDGINVILAGVYFSLGNSIGVKNSETKVLASDHRLALT